MVIGPPAQGVPQKAFTRTAVDPGPGVQIVSFLRSIADIEITPEVFSVPAGVQTTLSRSTAPGLSTTIAAGKEGSELPPSFSTDRLSDVLFAPPFRVEPPSPVWFRRR